MFGVTQIDVLDVEIRAEQTIVVIEREGVQRTAQCQMSRFQYAANKGGAQPMIAVRMHDLARHEFIEAGEIAGP